jgi:hypothetical protein
MAGQTIGSMNIKVGFDGSDARNGLVDLIQQVEQFSSSLTNIGSSLLAGVSLTGLVSQMKDLVKFSVEFGQKLDAASARMADGFGKLTVNTADLAVLAAKTGVDIENLADSMSRLGEAGLDVTEAMNLAEMASHSDNLFGGSGKGAEAFAEALSKLRGELTASNSTLKFFENRGVNVFERLAEQLGVTVEKAKELSRLGEISGLDAETALVAAKSTTRERVKHNSFFVSDADIEAAGYMDTSGPSSKELADIRSGLQKSRLAGFADMFSKAMETEADKLASTIAALGREIEEASGLIDPKSVKNLEVMRNYQQTLIDRADDLMEEKWTSQIDAIEAEIATQKKFEEQLRRSQESAFRSVATTLETLALDWQQAQEKLSAAMMAGDQLGANVANRSLGKLAAGLLTGIPEVHQADPFAGVSLAGSQQAYRDSIMSQFPPEVRSVQDRMADALDRIEETSREQLQLEEEALRALQGQGGPKLAHML